MVRAEFRPSLQLALVIACSHAAAAAVSCAIDLAMEFKIPLLASIAGSCAMGLYGPAMLRARHSIVEAALSEDGFSVRSRAGMWHAAVLQGSSFVAPYLTILNVRIDGWRFTRHIVIVPDRLDPEVYRQLRVWLRWRRTGDI